MDIENKELLTQQTLDLIGVLESFKLPITKSLVFDISQITKPLGTTRIVIEKEKTPLRTETIHLQISPNRLETIRKKRDSYLQKSKEASKFYYEESERLHTLHGPSLPKEDIDYLNMLECQMGETYSDYLHLDDLLGKNGTTFEQSIVTLGEYIPAKDCIKLYFDTICHHGGVDTAFFYTLVHELFHAFYHKSTRVQSPGRVEEIDEAMVEFSTLSYLASVKKALAQNPEFEDIFKAELRAVKKKQFGIGSTVSYGFGAYMFENCKNPKAWMSHYCSKFGLINANGKDVKSYIEDLNPVYTDDESETYSTLHKILFGRKTTTNNGRNWLTIEGGRVTKCSSNANGEIVIPDGVTEIGKDAFEHCTGLTSIEIPDSVTEIGASAFAGCTGLTSISIPDGITIIGEYAFKYCSGLKSIEIPDGVTEIGASAFEDCERLTSIEIPDSVTKIEEQAFYGCKGLTKVIIPKSVIKLGVGIFAGCSNILTISVSKENAVYVSKDNCCLTKDEKTLIFGCQSSVIPNEVIKIEDQAFAGCSGLTSIEIPDGVTEIGASAFYGCEGLTSIRIPDGITKIGEYTFAGCKGLTSIRIPDGITKIGEYAFWGCKGLTSIRIPDGITIIRVCAFEYCSGLKSIEIPDSVTEIGEHAFEKCASLKWIKLPNGIK